MQTTNVPSGYNRLMPYLILKNAAGFIQFITDVFGATEKIKHMRDEHIIMHAEMNIGDSVIMLADTTDDFSVNSAGLFIYVADADAVYSKAIALGATSLMPVSHQPYGRSGGIKDPFGNTWWITSAQ